MDTNFFYLFKKKFNNLSSNKAINSILISLLNSHYNKLYHNINVPNVNSNISIYDKNEYSVALYNDT